MSFKIFAQQLFGKIKPVEKIEVQRKTLLDDYNEFLKVKTSDELARYLELEKFLNSGEFKKKKEEIEKLQFKGSKEYNQLAELDKLKKKSSIKKYLKVEGSAELKRFETLKKSEKLEEFDLLFDYVKEGQFEKDKSEIKKQVFKGSVEEKHWIDYKKLSKSAGIKAYNEIQDSSVLKKHEVFSKSEKLKSFLQLQNVPERTRQQKNELKALQKDSEIKSYYRFEKTNKLKLYREMADSHDLKRFTELKSYVESKEFKTREAFLKDKTKFEKSEAYKKISRFKQLQADLDIRFYLKYEKSSLYKNYQVVSGSGDLKRYNELVGITSSDEFKNRKIYLEDKKKWEKMEGFARSVEFEKIKDLPHIKKYFKYLNSTSFAFFESWELVFEDHFKETKLNTEKWSVRTYVADKMLGDNYSLAGDLQVYTSGENVSTGGKLNIQVKKEKKTGKVWQMPAGFIPVALDYTSGVVSTWNSFWMEDGIVEAKIKFQPVKQIASSLYLSGENNLPRLNILEMGAKNHVGISALNPAGKVEISGLDISNLKTGWYIFTVVKQGGNVTWKINESEVHTEQQSALKTRMHLNASSLVVNEVSAGLLPNSFEMEWVKCYRKK